MNDEYIDNLIHEMLFKTNSTSNLVSSYESIDLQELNETIERLKKMPNYDDLIKENNKLQLNWNSLREWLKTDEQKYFTFQPRQNGKTLQAGIKVGLDMVLDKMNELEGKDNNGK